MFDVLRRSVLRLAHANRAAVNPRTSAVRTNPECLESRCMLSVAPGAAGYLLERGALDAAALNDVSIVVSGSMGVEASPGSGALRRAWPDAPWGLEPYPQMPPHTLPDSSASGGFIDIGKLDQTAMPEVMFDGAPDQDARDVLAMLSSLKYLPGNMQAEATPLPGEDATGSSATHQPNDSPAEAAGQLEGRHTDASVLAPAIATIGGDQSDHDQPEGGMIALVREGLTEEPATTAAIPEIKPLLRVPVPMESAYGKFQAFEVSSGEDALPPSKAPDLKGPTSAQPLSSATEAAPIANFDLLPRGLVRLNSDHGKFQPFEESAEEENPPPAAPPVARDAKTNSLVNVAAAALLFASAARAARPAVASQSDGHRAGWLRKPHQGRRG